jgi:hypothetical protein
MKVVPRSVLRLLVIVNVVLSLPIRSSETSVPTRVTWCHIPENDILHIQSSKNLKSWLGSVAEARCVSCKVRTWFLISQKTAFFIVTAVTT